MARILVADDEPDVLQLISMTLELEGHEVVSARDGAEAVRAAAAAPPDAIVLDIMMPGLDGLSALRQIRDTPSTSTVPVLLLSAKAGVLDIEEGMKRGASGYLTKPFEPLDLVAEVERVMAVRER